jgi:O-antigen/teichoic acid export membrane protein
MTATNDNKRIAKNTTMLYFRMMFNMLVTLYTSRIILNALGVNDFGIYNVVGGIVVMFSFLNSAMGAATSRFLIFELGKKDHIQLKKVFNASLSSHIGIALFVFLLAETVGLWFLTHKLVIPQDRMGAALWVYQFSILSAMVTLTQVPYNALIIAHEKMNIYAYVSVLDTMLKLLIAYLLVISNFDKLKFYAVLVFLVFSIIALIYRFYCMKHYAESAIAFKWDKKLYKELFSFSIWELYGGFALMGMGQGLNMLLNMFFGPAVNAARGIAFQVQGAVLGFGDNFITAVKPQIIKLYAENNIKQMMNLVFSSSKYSLFLTFFLTLPLLLETPFVLDVWLKTVPDYTVSFCRLILVNNLIWSMRNPIVTCFHAVGQLKIANLVCGSLFYLIVIVSYFCLKSGLAPDSIFIVTIVVSVMVQVAELLLLKLFIRYSVKEYVIKVVGRCILVMAASAIIPYFLCTMLESGFTRFITIGFASVFAVMISVFTLGIDSETRGLVVLKVKFIIQKIRR